MIRRPPRSTLSSSSAASDVYKRQPILPWPGVRWNPSWKQPGRERGQPVVVRLGVQLESGVAIRWESGGIAIAEVVQNIVEMAACHGWSGTHDGDGRIGRHTPSLSMKIDPSGSLGTRNLPLNIVLSMESPTANVSIVVEYRAPPTSSTTRLPSSFTASRAATAASRRPTLHSLS
eukprot:TRINITY_DN60867_c0_g1_i1.p1 TRINITY_DN60867_c0_g1~~TRINITY_DN60867_c0_g1_i1.p1  ORF type:complete len:175 (+),score=17.95 TRINITY_DN60867_c0_g1_i1:98-622(+)